MATKEEKDVAKRASKKVKDIATQLQSDIAKYGKEGAAKKAKQRAAMKDMGEGFQKGFTAGDVILDKASEGSKLMTPEMKDVIEKRKRQAEVGIEEDVLREQKTKVGQQMLEAQKLKGLRLGSALGGMTGASAAAQQRTLASEGMAAKAGIERDLFLAKEAAKAQGLDALEETARFDVTQRGREAEFLGTLGLGYEGLEVQREAGIAKSKALEEAGKAGGEGSILQDLIGMTGQAYQPLGFNPAGFVEDVGDFFKDPFDW